MKHGTQSRQVLMRIVLPRIALPMTVDVRSGRLRQIPGTERGERFRQRGRLRRVYPDTRCFEHPESFRTAVSGNQTIGMDPRDSLGRLYSRPLHGVEVLFVIDELEGLRIRVVDEEPGSTAEPGVEPCSEIGA